MVRLAKGAVPSVVRNAIRRGPDARVLAGIEGFFAVSLADGTPNPRIDFGARMVGESGSGEVPLSQIHDVIDDAPGVWSIDDGPDGVTLNGTRSSLLVAKREFFEAPFETLVEEFETLLARANRHDRRRNTTSAPDGR